MIYFQNQTKIEVNSMADSVMDSVFKNMEDKRSDIDIIRFISDNGNSVLVTRLEHEFTEDRVKQAHQRGSIVLSSGKLYYYTDEVGQDNLFMDNLAKL